MYVFYVSAGGEESGDGGGVDGRVGEQTDALAAHERQEVTHADAGVDGDGGVLAIERLQTRRVNTDNICTFHSSRKDTNE